jgi:hypothetical protein
MIDLRPYSGVVARIVARIVRSCAYRWGFVSGRLSERQGHGRVGERVRALPADELALVRARLGLWRAAGRHSAVVWICRRRLRRAERVYRRGCRRGWRDVRAAEKEASGLVAEAQEQFRALMRPRQVASYGPFVLYDDSLHEPDGEVSLASVRAVILPPDAGVPTGAGIEALAPEETPGRGKRHRLVVWSREGVTVHDLRNDDAEAHEFARLLNVAALNASHFNSARTAQINHAAERVEEARALAVARLTAARERLDSLQEDTSAIQEAKRLLVGARLATSEVDRSRATLALHQQRTKRRSTE